MPEAQATEQQGEAAVRFASQDEEIAPETSISSVATLTGAEEKDRRELNPEAQEEIMQLKSTLQQAVQSKRFEQFSFEPVSLPGSQTPSRVSAPSSTITELRTDYHVGPIRYESCLQKTRIWCNG